MTSLVPWLRRMRGLHPTPGGPEESVTVDVSETAIRVLGACEAERDFLIARFLNPAEHDYGISSDAMIREALGGDPVRPGEYPRDRGDLGRCERAYERAPEHLQRRMLRRLSSFREAVNLAEPYMRGER